MKKNRRKDYQPAHCLLCGKDNSLSGREYAPVVNLHIGVFTDNHNDVTVYTLCDDCFLKPDKRELAELKIGALKKRGVL